TQHNPEFTMLEFYQAYTEYQALMRMTEEMIAYAAREAVGTETVPFGDHTITLTPPYRRLSMRDAVRERASARLGVTLTDADLRDRTRVEPIARQLGVEVKASEGAGMITAALFELLWEEDLIQPTFVYDFPTEVSPLSKQRKDDPDTV